MFRDTRVHSLRQYLQCVLDRRACSDPKQNASTGRHSVRDLNPDVVMIGVDAGHLQQPFVKTDAHAPLVQRPEPAIHNFGVIPITRLLSRHAR